MTTSSRPSGFRPLSLLDDSGPLIVRVLPDVPAIEKTFDYLVPEPLRDQVRVGALVRIQLHGRRVGGWIVAVHVEPPAGVKLQPIARISGAGPTADLIELAEWAAHRWVGRIGSFLRTASPPGIVRVRDAVPVARPPIDSKSSPQAGSTLVRDALSHPRPLIRFPPAADRFGLLRELVDNLEAQGGHALVICVTAAEARRLGERFGREGRAVAVLGQEVPPRAGASAWARAARGCTTVGTRGSIWTPVGGLAGIVVLDEHDEGYQQQQAPTWHARDVAVERARRAEVPCVLISPCPSLEALAWRGSELPTSPNRQVERAGWPALETIDRREEPPGGSGLYSPRLVELLRSPGRVVCVLNRTGRSRLLACSTCGELTRCERCDAAVEQQVPGTLHCRRCGTERPTVCLRCGTTRLKNLRVGVSRAREELAALVGEPVDEVTAATDVAGDSRVIVGTEAVLHRVERAEVVAFLDFDQELGAPRYRAGEQALALLVRGARLVRGRADHGRIVVQTRQPDHVVLAAALHGDPARLAESELRLRRAMRFPPAAALATISGASAPAFITALGQPPGVEVLGPTDGQWLIRAVDHAELSGALVAVPRPQGRLRIEVDPLRI